MWKPLEDSFPLKSDDRSHMTATTKQHHHQPHPPALFQEDKMFVCGLYYERAESLVFVIFMDLTLKTGGRGVHSEAEVWQYAVVFR